MKTKKYPRFFIPKSSSLTHILGSHPVFIVKDETDKWLDGNIEKAEWLIEVTEEEAALYQSL